MDRRDPQDQQPSVALTCTALHETGGTSRHMLQIYRHLDRSRVRPIIVFYSRQEETLRQFFVDGGVADGDLFAVRLGITEGLMSGIRHLRRIWREQRVEVVHTFFLHSDIWGWASTRFRRHIRLVSSVEGKFIWDRTNGVNGLKQMCYRVLNRMIGRSFAVTVTVSKRLQKEAGAAGRRPVRVVPVGIPVPDTLSLPAPRVTGERTIGTLARFSPDKGIDLLLQAVPRLRETIPGVRVVIGGQGEDEEALRKQARELDIDGAVIFAGWVEDAATFLRRLDIFVLPSRREGCPLGLLEAMANGRPVVAFAVDGVDEIVTPEVNGLLTSPFDPTQLADTVVRLCRDAGLSARLAKNGYQLMKERFSISTEMQHLYQCYLPAPSGHRHARK